MDRLNQAHRAGDAHDQGSRLAMPKQVLDHMKGMLHLRPDARLELLEPNLQPAQFFCRQDLAHAALHRHQPFDGLALVLGTFLNALVTRITESGALLAMQQGVGLAVTDRHNRATDDRHIGASLNRL